MFARYNREVCETGPLRDQELEKLALQHCFLWLVTPVSAASQSVENIQILYVTFKVEISSVA